MKTETIRMAKMNGMNDRLKFILIGIAIGIVLGMALIYLLINFGAIKPYNIFSGTMNRGSGGFPGNGTQPGPMR